MAEANRFVFNWFNLKVFRQYGHGVEAVRWFSTKDVRHFLQKVCWHAVGITGSVNTSMQMEQSKCFEMRLLSTNSLFGAGSSSLGSGGAFLFLAGPRGLPLGGIFFSIEFLQNHVKRNLQVF